MDYLQLAKLKIANIATLKKAIIMSLRLISFFLLFIIAGKFMYGQDFKRYGVESAIVEYELTGMQTGNAIMYFDAFGMREATYENSIVDVYGTKQETENVNYLDGFWQYNYDKQSNTGTKTKNTVLESLVKNSGGDLEQIGIEMFESMGGKKSGTEELIGKLCEIWELESMGTRVWVWKNVLLKTETNMMGVEILRVATSIQVDVEIPSDKISVPSDVEFQELDMNNIQDLMKID